MRWHVKNARELGIVINTIHCGEHEVGKNTGWLQGATLGGGRYTSINHNQSTVFIPSPFDDEIATLNARLNSTYIAYSADRRQYQQRQEAQDANASKYSSANMAKRAKSKVSGYYDNSKWDLIDAVEKEEELMDSIDFNDDHWKGTEFEGKDKVAAQKLIQEKAEEREQVKKKILEISKKREAYVAQQKKEQGAASLDQALIEALHQQAQAKAYTFKKD